MLPGIIKPQQYTTTVTTRLRSVRAQPWHCPCTWSNECTLDCNRNKSYNFKSVPFVSKGRFVTKRTCGNTLICDHWPYGLSCMHRRHLHAKIRFTIDAISIGIITIRRTWVNPYIWINMALPASKVHGSTWGPSGTDRAQVGPMLAPWTLLSGFTLK